MSAIIVLEGVNGLGKTTYAQRLSERLGVPVYRAFRDKISEHWGDRSERELMLREQFGVPLNTHVDDLYAADIVSRLGAGVIFDRSLPSALAYGKLQGDAFVEKSGGKMLEFWEAILVSSALPVRYVWLRGEYELAKERCAGRASSWPLTKAKYAVLEKVFEKVFAKTRLPKQQINVGSVEYVAGVASIVRSLG